LGDNNKYGVPDCIENIANEHLREENTVVTVYPDSHNFYVKSKHGEKFDRFVRLFNDGAWRPTCTCNPATTCSHIVIAMKAIDYHRPSSNKKKAGVNVTRAMKLGRTQSDKRRGKKGPGKNESWRELNRSSKVEDDITDERARLLREEEEMNAGLVAGDVPYDGITVRYSTTIVSIVVKLNLNNIRNIS